MNKVLLHTEHLTVRNLEMRDAEVMWDYRNNDVCARYQRGQLKELDKIKLFISARTNDVPYMNQRHIFALELTEGGEMIGELTVFFEGDRVIFGYTVSYKHQRRGYAYEAMTAVLNDVKLRCPGMIPTCYVDPMNEVSKRLLEKLGFSFAGYVKETDSDVYEIK